jgi:O-antigen ligase
MPRQAMSREARSRDTKLNDLQTAPPASGIEAARFMPTSFKLARIQADWTALAAAGLLFLYPILLLTVREGVNVCFAVLVVLAFYCLFTGRASFRDLNRGEIAFGAAMASLVAATALSQSWHGHFESSPYDGAGRFLLAFPIYLMLRPLRETPASLHYGAPLGAIAAALVVLPQLPLTNGARASTDYMDAIRFGDLALALGLLSVASINANRTDAPWLVAVKIAGAAAGLFASIESGTRGGWIALPPVALTGWWLAGRGRLSWRLGAAAGALLIVLAALIYLFVGKVHDRVADLDADLAALSHADFDTSLGLRLQIWRVAVRLFTENPVFGIGPDAFPGAVARMRDLGLLTLEGAANAHAEVHNEILLHTVSLGIFGLAAIVSIYAAPLVLFIRAATAAGAPARVRSAGVMGACFVTAFLVFGLTIEIFNLKLIATFYSLTVAVLLAVTAHKEASG